MSLWKFVSHITKEGHQKNSLSLDNNFLKMGNTCNKVSHLSITNFMANILADKTSYSDFSF